MKITDIADKLVNKIKIVEECVLFIAKASANYTCQSKNLLGVDKLKHHIIVLLPPSKPIVKVIEADKTSLNISIGCDDNGGAPILGKNLKIIFF